MKGDIKKLALNISHKKTRDLIQNHVVKIDRRELHVSIYVDNAAPLRDLGGGLHEKNLQKALDHVYGEDVTYELKLFKRNTTHERSDHVMRQPPRV